MLSFKEFILESLREAASGGKHGVMIYGRMNPITAGHEKVVDKLHQIAKENNAVHQVVLSHSHDPKKNPLTPEEKVHFAKKAFPGTNVKASDKSKPTILHHASDMYNEHGVKNLHVVVGSDRVEDMTALLNKYNGVEGKHGSYKFNKITVHSAGERDPDSDDTSGVSGTKMRELAAKGNEKAFHANLPSKMAPEHKTQLYHAVRKGMGH